jgi:hypothetical protein
MCLSAFIAVFILLGILAILMKITLKVFPAKAGDSEAVLAAIATTMHSIYPQHKITKIEEVK